MLSLNAELQCSSGFTFHLTFHFTRSYFKVYDAAAVLAKYLESPHFASKDKKGGSLQGQKLIELGAGTGVVGMLAGEWIDWIAVISFYSKIYTY